MSYLLGLFAGSDICIFVALFHCCIHYVPLAGSWSSVVDHEASRLHNVSHLESLSALSGPLDTMHVFNVHSAVDHS